MSKRDRGLLDAAGLSVAEAARLFQRSRQAIYTGLSHRRDYFSAQNAMFMVHDAKRTDSSRIDGLVKFIAANYPQSESERILFDQVGYEQVTRVVSEADQVMLVFNGNIDHLAPTATFARLLTELVAEERSIFFIVPGEWVAGYMKQHLGLDVPSPTVRDDTTYLPSFVVIEKQGSFRAFVFLRLSIEEMHPVEAARLWKHFSPMSLENAGHTDREAG